MVGRFTLLQLLLWLSLSFWIATESKCLIQPDIFGHVDIPGSMIKIPISAFDGCTELYTIYMPDTVVELDERAFKHCTNLTSVTLPPKLLYIAMEAFYGCYGLQSVTFGTRVTMIATDAFVLCIGLRKVHLPASVLIVGPTAFAGCLALAEVIIDSHSINFIHNNAFNNCPQLKALTLLRIANITGEGGIFDGYGCNGHTPGQEVGNYFDCGCNPGYGDVIPNDPSYFACLPCSAGRAQGQIAQKVCENCAPGTYAGHTQQNLCTFCGAGKYSSINGSITEEDCINCAIGRYSSSPAARECRPCPPGSRCPDKGSKNYEECAVGKYNSASGQLECDPCEPGHYQNDKGQAVCLPCPLGKFYNSTGAGSREICEECPAGRYGDNDGLAVCNVCPTSQYQAETGAQTCEECGAYETNTEDHTTCKDNEIYNQDGFVDAMFKKGVALSLSIIIAAAFVILAGVMQYAKESYQSRIGKASANGDFETDRDGDHVDHGDDSDNRLNRNVGGDVEKGGEEEEEKPLGMLGRHQVVLKSALPGLSFGSEVFLIIAMIEYAPGLAAVMLSFRLLHPITVIVLNLALFHPKLVARNSFLQKISTDAELHEGFMVKHVPQVSFFLFISACDSSLVQMMPWNKSKFHSDSVGFPSAEVMRLIMSVKSVQTLVSVICQLVYLAGSHDVNDPTMSVEAQVLFGLSITFSLANLMLGLVMFCVRGSLLDKNRQGNQSSEEPTPQEQEEPTPPTQTEEQRAGSLELHNIYSQGPDAGGVRMSNNPMHEGGGGLPVTTTHTMNLRQQEAHTHRRQSMMAFEAGATKQENKDLKREVESLEEKVAAQREEIATLKSKLTIPL